MNRYTVHKDVICDIGNKVGEGGAVKEQRFYMQLKLRCCQFKMERYSTRGFCAAAMTATKKIPIERTRGNEKGTN